MSAEDYHDVPGFGGGFAGSSFKPRSYTCNFCKAPISFTNRKPFNQDGTPHRCKAAPKAGYQAEPETPQQATVFAMAAMNAIINAQIQVGGVDFIHHMSFQDIADAAWQASAAMVRAEKNYRYDFGCNT